MATRSFPEHYHHFEDEIYQAATVTFAQNGEDLVILGLVGSEFDNKGIYVDIGAYHPFRFSNTFLLYLHGWRGVNIDANPDAVELFDRLRPDETNIRALVDCTEGKRYYTYFAEPAYNSIRESSAPPANPPSEMIGSEEIETQEINKLLLLHVGDKKFDFLNLDMEGVDLSVLKSIDFSRFRPKVIAIEIDFTWVTNDDFLQFLNQIHYRIHTPCYHTLILVSR